MSKFGDDIRRIAGYEKLLKLIREVEKTAEQAKKLAIEARKSIAYLDNQSLQTTATAGTPGVTKPNASGAGVNLKNAAAIGGSNPFSSGTGTTQDSQGQSSAKDKTSPENGVSENGSTSDLASTDNTEKDGWHDAESVLNGEADANGKRPPTPSTNYPATPQNTTGFQPETLRVLTGLQTDDETRQLIVSLDTMFIAPDDWDDAWTGPGDPSWSDGLVWKLITGGNSIFAPTFQQLISEREAVDGTKAYGVSGGFVVSTTPTSGQTLQFSTELGAGVGDPTGPLGGTIYNFEAYTAGDSILTGQYGQQDCGLEAGDGASCAITAAPPLTVWDDLGVSQLAWLSPYIGRAMPYSFQYIGRFMPNPADIINTPSAYQEGASILDVKTLSGDEVRIGPLKEGGWYMYYRNPADSNNPVGPPEANSVVIIRSDKTVQGFVTPNQLATMLP